MSARLFIRNDDAWTLDGSFRFFFDAAFEREIPVVHAVIPGRMEAGLVRFLCRTKERHPHLIDIVQHGWMHADHSHQAGQKYEFGPSRSLKAQQEDIRRGLQKMRRAFGDLFTPAFVPPYHGYDERTLRVLQEEGFQVLSAGGRRPGSLRDFLELPARISFSRYEGNRRAGVFRANEIIAMLAKDAPRRSLTGVLTHHQDFKGQVLRRELTRFFGLVKGLEEKKGCRVLLFSELLKQKKKI